MRSSGRPSTITQTARRNARGGAGAPGCRDGRATLRRRHGAGPLGAVRPQVDGGGRPHGSRLRPWMPSRSSVSGGGQMDGGPVGAPRTGPAAANPLLPWCMPAPLRRRGRSSPTQRPTLPRGARGTRRRRLQCPQARHGPVVARHSIPHSHIPLRRYVILAAGHWSLSAPVPAAGGGRPAYRTAPGTACPTSRPDELPSTHPAPRSPAGDPHSIRIPCFR